MVAGGQLTCGRGKGMGTTSFDRARHIPKLPTITSMLARRRPRLITVLFALFSLLFMQLAVAGYACPMDGKASEMAAMDDAAMPCAGEMSPMDTEQPALCHAHCQSTQQAADKFQTAMPVIAVAAGFAYVLEPVRIFSPVPRPAQAPLLLRSTAPPIAVRNCCFRI